VHSLSSVHNVRSHSILTFLLPQYGDHAYDVDMSVADDCYSMSIDAGTGPGPNGASGPGWDCYRQVPPCPPRSRPLVPSPLPLRTLLHFTLEPAVIQSQTAVTHSQTAVTQSQTAVTQSQTAVTQSLMAVTQSLTAVTSL
jgi:hypothetical protein